MKTKSLPYLVKIRCSAKSSQANSNQTSIDPIQNSITQPITTAVAKTVLSPTTQAQLSNWV